MSEKFVIEPCGALRGIIEICGAKNAVLPVLAASLLTEKPCVLQNVPRLSDVEAMCVLIESLGAKISCERDSFTIDASNVQSLDASYELVGKLRASFLIMGPLLARFGRAKVPLPGGCAIGSRPVDLHLKGFAALGAKIDHSHGFVTVTAKRLKGAKIYLDFPSVGATENIMMAAVLADGQTI
ncbi:MAG: UDP-N-acetylglucosamine 1-carboxyvinyltransferase, partial [Defluviitaleaceae bacterium]|nr:UDP-N-acetylglucosamine 1-carboxyvinyltransferase [Defluviitaleaceae bacterium]